jgi:DNA-directed RNA polymerase subunit E'/Rpb7
MDALFVRSLLRDAVLVKPMFLGSNYREMVQQLMHTKVEGVCSRHGFVMPGSVAVHKVAPGRLEAVSLNGDVRFDMQYYANVCNPPVGTILKARVVNVNKFGILAHSGVLLPNGDFVPVVETIITKQPVAATAASEIDLDSVAQGDEINVEILGKKFELNDTKISVIGRAVKPGSTTPASAASAPVLPHLVDGGYGDEAVDDDNPEQVDSEEEEDQEEEDADSEDADDDEDDDDDAVADDDDDDDDDNGKKNTKSKKSAAAGDAKKSDKGIKSISVSYDTEEDDDDAIRDRLQKGDDVAEKVGGGGASDDEVDMSDDEDAFASENDVDYADDGEGDGASSFGGGDEDYVTVKNKD